MVKMVILVETKEITSPLTSNRGGAYLKKLGFILIFVSIILFGCTQNGNEEAEDDNRTDQSEEVDKETEDERDLEETEVVESEVDEVDEAGEKGQNTNDDNHQAEEETIEEKEIMYEIVGIGGFAPIDDADPNVVLITIDDVPDKNGLEMAKTLKQLDVPAIFFVNGHFINTEEKQAVLKEIHDMGFAIGNHTYSHKNLQQISEEEQYEEIISLNELIEEVIGEKPKFFRAPHGANTDYASKLVEDEGMLLMNWTYGYDYFEPYMDKDKLIEAMVTGEGPEVGVDYSLLKPGANLLMHDREWTKEALPHIVEGLQEQGYGFIDPDTILTPEQQ